MGKPEERIQIKQISIVGSPIINFPVPWEAKLLKGELRINQVVILEFSDVTGVTKSVRAKIFLGLGDTVLAFDVESHGSEIRLYSTLSPEVQRTKKMKIEKEPREDGGRDFPRFGSR